MKILWLTPQFPVNSRSIKGIYIYRTVKYLSEFYDITTCFFYPQLPPLLKIISDPKKSKDLFRYWRDNSPSKIPNLKGISNEKLLFIKYLRLPRGLFHHIEAYFVYLTLLFKKKKLKDIVIPKNKTILLDNIYDTKKFNIFSKNELRNKYNFSQNEKIIFFVGGLVKIKNIDVLISSFNLLEDKNTILLIAGDGPEKNALEQTIKKLQLDKRIELLGNLNGDKLVDFYNISDTLCLPSKNEGTPNVIIEALLCGLPVVATNVGGIPKLIDHKVNGLLVEPNNSVTLTKYLEQSFRTKWDRGKLRSSAKRFFPDNVKQSYDQLFTQLSRAGL